MNREPRLPRCRALIDTAFSEFGEALGEVAAGITGFLDAVAAYLLLALEGCQLSPETWDVLEALSAGH